MAKIKLDPNYRGKWGLPVLFHVLEVMHKFVCKRVSSTLIQVEDGKGRDATLPEDLKKDLEGMDCVEEIENPPEGRR